MTHIWITLMPDTSKLKIDTVGKIKTILKVINQFCVTYMPSSELNIFDFKIIKVDTTVDLKGSFLPSSLENAKDMFAT
jgi:hypothetical protein